MKIEDAIKFFRSTFVDMAEWGSRAVKGSTTERNVLTHMQHIETAIDALEKQVPKKPVKNEYDCVCPVCGFGCLTDEKYCLDCGQALEWE